MSATTKILIVLFVILAVVVVYYLQPAKEREASYKTSDLNLAIDSASVNKIEIQKLGKSIALENTDGKWMITSPGRYTANASTVTQLLSSFSKFIVGSLISSNPEKQGMFQVDSTGTKVTVTQRSGKSVILVVGKMGPSYSEAYFRLPDSKDVYMGEGLSTWTLNQDLKEWRDKTIFSTPSDSIKELSLEFNNESFVFTHENDTWKLNNDSIEQSVVTPALTALSSLHADDFIDSNFTPTTKPMNVKIHASEDVVLSLFPQPPDSARYAVQTSQSPQVYLLSKWTVQQIRKPIEKYVK